MAVRDVFHKGDRVKPSRKAIRANLWRSRAAVPTGGVVAAKPYRALSVTIRWDGRAVASSYHKDFISRDRKGTRPPGAP